MKKNIQVRYKNIGGVEAIVPVCETAKTFANIAATSHLTKPAIASIKALGFRVDVLQEVRCV